LSEDFLNWASHQTNGRTTDGSFFSDAVRGLNRFGVARAELMPNTATYDPKARPSAKALADALGRRSGTPRWIKEWDVKTGLSAAQLWQIKERLAAGRPVAIGMRWPKKEAFGPAHVLKTPPPSGVRDGHSVVLVGYSDDVRHLGGGTFL